MCFIEWWNPPSLIHSSFWSSVGISAASLKRRQLTCQQSCASLRNQWLPFSGWVHSISSINFDIIRSSMKFIKLLRGFYSHSFDYLVSECRSNQFFMCTFVSGLPITVLFPGQVGRGFSLVKPGFLQAALLIRKAIRGYKYCNGILQRQVQSLYSNHSQNQGFRCWHWFL